MTEPTLVAVTDRTPLSKELRLRLRTPAKYRNRELLLLLLAFTINLSAVALVELGALGEVTDALYGYSVALCVLVLVAHLCLRLVAPEADPLILPIATVLNGLGIAAIYRLDLDDGLQGWDAASVRQIAWTAIAITFAVVVLIIIRNHRVLLRFRYIAGFTGLVLLLLPLVPGIGYSQFGAQLWIRVGPASFQPGELAKIALAIFFAGYLVEHRESLSLVGKKMLGMRFPRARDLGPILIAWVAAMAVLIFQRDLGTALLYFGLFLVMIYVATGRISWVILGLLLFAGGAAAAAGLFSHVGNRFTAWLDAFNPEVYDAVGGSYQLVQGIFGLAQGGLIGTGLGQGRPYLVPLAQNDFIVASLGEELGLAGLFAILALYLLFVARGLRVGYQAPDDFGRLLAVGLSFVVALQVFIVVGGVTRLIPLTGLTTPFLAAGGSSLVANWIIAALILRLSDTIRTGPHVVVGP
ncbi:MAG TPA: FtsW/RodA/SpoVE family cell cycle protein [Terrimesophilobacter sp.]|nr:FtsW/RodA/SpoVE family cell cycle protein [Terrimesophilobacter sp.]